VSPSFALLFYFKFNSRFLDFPEDRPAPGNEVREEHKMVAISKISQKTSFSYWAFDAGGIGAMSLRSKKPGQAYMMCGIEYKCSDARSFSPSVPSRVIFSGS
jgi:hypothetical protein